MRDWEELEASASSAEEAAKSLRARADAARCPSIEDGGYRCQEDRNHEAKGIPHRAEVTW